MKNYFSRVIKYFIYLLVLFGIIYGLMYATGFSTVSPEYFSDFLSTSKGQFMVAAIIGLALLYPFYGVTSRKVERIGSAELVLKMLELDYKLSEKKDKKMIFIKTRFVDRLKYRFDDTIEINNSHSEYTLIRGSRRAVVAILYRLGSNVL